MVSSAILSNVRKASSKFGKSVIVIYCTYIPDQKHADFFKNIRYGMIIFSLMWQFIFHSMNFCNLVRESKRDFRI